MAEFTVYRGSAAQLDFAVKEPDGSAYDLTGASLEWNASNGTRTLSKTSAAGITVVDDEAGTCYVTLDAADTSSWTDSEPVLNWSLEVTPLAGDPEIVAIGALSVIAPVPDSAPAGGLYATPDDFIDFLGEDLLAQFSAESGTTLSRLRLERVLRRASSFIDGYLGGRYVVPISGAAALPILSTHCVQIAKAILLGRRIASRLDPGETDLYGESVAWLKRVAEGKASLAGATERMVAATATGVATAGSDAIIFDDPNGEETTGGLI